jgi:fermentation-respiration switch protein FrsA (DUF1100 family)
MGLFSRFERGIIFRPCPFAVDWLPPPRELNAQDVALRTVDGTVIHGWWCVPVGWQVSDGATLYCHGNAGNLSHRAEGLRRWQTLLSQAVLIFDYPGYGKSEGRPTENGCYAAGEVMYRFLVDNQHVPPERIILYGGSLGGAVAVELASKFDHRALVLVSAFASILDMAKVTFPYIPFLSLFISTQFDNVAKMPMCKAPIFIAHGTADRVVPFAQGEQLCRAVCGPCRFFPMENYDHNHTPGPEFYQALREFLETAPKS